MCRMMTGMFLLLLVQTISTGCLSEMPISPEPTPPTLPEPELACGRNLLEVGLPKGSIAINTSSGHWADPECIAHVENNGKLWYQVERKEGVCGTVLRVNRSHAIYSNTLFVYPFAKGNVAFSLPISFPFSCMYPMETQTGMGVPIKPDLSMQEMGVVRAGTGARVSMSLYHNASFSVPHPAGNITLPVSVAMNVGVAVEDVETDQFNAMLEDCYATHTANLDDPERHYLIQNRCPSDRRQVIIVESGVSLWARFTARLFLYRGDDRDFFLHCSLSLCDRRMRGGCTATCLKRRSRSTSHKTALTIGPITWTKGPE